MNRLNLAFLGLGIMGGPMAANLAKAGHTVRGWNRSSGRPGAIVAGEAGVEIVDSLEKAVRDSQVIVTCVSDVPDAKEIILGAGGLINFVGSNAIVIDTSTIGPGAAREIHDLLKEKDIHFMDAPISGGDIGAKNGTLTIMVGGDRKKFDYCMPVFEVLGKTIRYCGPPGSGQAVKLCNQILCAINMVSVCESLTLAESLEIDRNLVVDICSTGAAGSWALQNLGPKIISGDLDPAFMIKHMRKDLRLVREALSSGGNELPGTRLADELFEKVSELDDGSGDLKGTQAMIRAYSSLQAAR